MDRAIRQGDRPLRIGERTELDPRRLDQRDRRPRRIARVGDHEAKSLADVYNQRLRRELGLPVVRREPLLRDVKLLPFIARGETGGLALGARF